MLEAGETTRKVAANRIRFYHNLDDITENRCSSNGVNAFKLFSSDKREFKCRPRCKESDFDVDSNGGCFQVAHGALYFLISSWIGGWYPSTLQEKTWFLQLGYNNYKRNCWCDGSWIEYLLLLLLLDLLMIGSKMDELQVRRTRPKLAYKK